MRRALFFAAWVHIFDIVSQPYPLAFVGLAAAAASMGLFAWAEQGNRWGGNDQLPASLAPRTGTLKSQETKHG